MRRRVSERSRKLCGSLVCAWLVAPADARAQPVDARVTVQARPRFEVVSRELVASALALRVKLVDDAGVALVAARVAAAVPKLARYQLQPCADDSGARVIDGGVSLVTDGAGTICAQAAGYSESDSVVFAFNGDDLHLPAREQVALHAEDTRWTLQFEAGALEFELERPVHEVRLIDESAKPGGELPRLDVELHAAGQVRTLETSAWTRRDGAISFELSSDQLGPPGPARLVVRPSARARAMERAEAVALRLAEVQLTAELAELDEGRAELLVTASSVVGPPTSGWIQAEAPGRKLAHAALVDGRARLSVTFPETTPPLLTLSYRPDEAWWQPGAPFALDLSARKPSAPARWPWFVLLLGIAYVCLRTLERPAPRRSRERPRAAPEIPELRTQPSHRASGWSGTVVDAHEGRPIAGARVEITLPSLREPASSVAMTDAAGQFAIPTLAGQISEGALFRVSAAKHTEVVRPLPPQGRVDVALSSRRRSLLRRLVRWARSSGPPWHGPHEPTPGEIAAVALRRGEPGIALWAEQVGEAAFGHGDVDEAREARVRSVEPGRPRGAPPLVEDPEE